MQGGPAAKSNVVPWVVGGCGALLLVSTCCGGVGSYFYIMQRREQRAEDEMMRVEAQRQQEERAAQEEAAQEEAARHDAEEEAARQANGDPLAAAAPLSLTMTVTSSNGVPAVTVGTVCRFDVAMHDLDQGPSCQAHVECNGVKLYGDTDDNGYFPCTLTASSVVGADTGTTSADTDPAISIDTTAGTIAISDDGSGHLGAFHVTGTVSAFGGLGLQGIGAAGS